MEREEEEFQQRKRDRERRIIRIEKQELNSRLLEVITIYLYMFTVYYWGKLCSKLFPASQKYY